jgi:23S rRNA pseudouridine2605 synthase
VEERIQKILSRAGVSSRRGAEAAITAGRVTVNGETITQLGTRADAAADDIRVDGVRVQPPAAPVYLLLNKPKGVVSTRQDPEGRPTVMALVPPVAGLFPVGRLDVTTEGLLLLTNDGAFAQRVAHPRYEVPRVYHAKVHKVPSPEVLERLRRGVNVEGERMTVDRVRVIEAENNAWLEVTLHEGKHHEVRRMLEAVGHPVSKLRRVGLGPLSARGLKPGQFRSLTPAEVRAFLSPPRSRPAPREERPDRPRPSRKPGGARRPGSRPSSSHPPATRSSSTRPPSTRPSSHRPSSRRPSTSRPPASPPPSNRPPARRSHSDGSRPRGRR